MKAVERGLRADLRQLPKRLQASGPARALIEVAKRIDAEPHDQMMVALSRELRLGLAALLEQADGVAGEAEVYLERMRASAVSQPRN